MTEKNKRAGQLFNFARDSYLERTSRPVYAIIFLLPFIALYEVGTILINTDVLNQSQVRVVAFVWLQDLLEYLGFGSKFAWAAPPMAVVIILIGLQLASRKSWRFHLLDYFPMAGECILLAIPLIMLGLFINSSTPRQADMSQAKTIAGHVRILSLQAWHTDAKPPIPAPSKEALQPPKQSLPADIITGIGAGIYEELVFRLILICLLMMLFQDLLRFDRTKSIIFSVLISAALFSAHHHVIFVAGDLTIKAPLGWAEFVFRTLAGVYFAALFAIRGFGITAGTHAFYDTLAVLINVLFFGR